MATIVTRSGKGSPLTHAEVDSNFTNLNTDKLETAGGSMTGNLSFGDNDKAIFGAGSDLQIYHDGSNSTVRDLGTGDLIMRGTNIRLQAANGETYFYATENGDVDLYYDNSVKLSTSSSGISVSGTVTADSGYFQGSNSFINDTMTLNFAAPNGQVAVKNSSGSPAANLYFYTTDTSGSTKLRQGISYNGDISFYEDTGTTAKFFWDASAEGLNIGTTSAPYGKLDVSDVGGSGVSTIFDTGANGDNYFTAGTSGIQVFRNGSSERMRIDSSGRVGIGNTIPSQLYTNANDLVVGSGTSDHGITVYTNNSAAGALYFADGTTGNAEYRGGIAYIHQATEADEYLSLVSGGATRMWIKPSGNVGIGTSSPTSGYLSTAALDVSGPVVARGAVSSNQTNAGVLQYYSNETAIRSYGATAGSGQITFSTGGGGSADTERMRIDSSGNVGIGISNPASYDWSNTIDLVVGDTSGSSGLSIVSSTSGGGNIAFADGTTGDERYRGYIYYDHASDYMSYWTAGSEAMRIESSGHLLLGTTDAGIYDDATDEAGHNLLANGQYYNSAVSEINMILNKQNSDGDIVQFRKNGSTVGSIGTYSSGLDIAGSSRGIRFSGSTIFPVTNAGGVSDNSVQLGYSGGRFKDLYLSGGVYLGGTGSANKLDDYEEGTWTPVWIGSGSNPTVTYSNKWGRYTKIGDYVSCVGQITYTSISGGSGYAWIAGLPFTSASFGEQAFGQVGYITTFDAGYNPIAIHAANNDTYCWFYYQGSAGGNISTSPSVTNLASSGTIYFSVHYKVA